MGGRIGGSIVFGVFKSPNRNLPVKEIAFLVASCTSMQQVLDFGVEAEVVYLKVTFLLDLESAVALVRG